MFVSSLAVDLALMTDLASKLGKLYYKLIQTCKKPFTCGSCKKRADKFTDQYSVFIHEAGF